MIINAFSSFDSSYCLSTKAIECRLRAEKGSIQDKHHISSNVGECVVTHERVLLSIISLKYILIKNTILCGSGVLFVIEIVVAQWRSVLL